MAFPVLAGGVRVHLPFFRGRSYRNTSVDMENGFRYAFTTYAFPLMTWVITYTLTDADLVTIQAHWNETGGMKDTFAFTDPETEVTYPKVRYDQQALEITHAGPEENLVTVRLKECR